QGVQPQASDQVAVGFDQPIKASMGNGGRPTVRQGHDALRLTLLQQRAEIDEIAWETNLGELAPPIPQQAVASRKPVQKQEAGGGLDALYDEVVPRRDERQGIERFTELAEGCWRHAPAPRQLDRDQIVELVAGPHPLFAFPLHTSRISIAAAHATRRR